RLYWARKDFTQATALLERALEVRERNIAVMLATGSEDGKRASMSTVRDQTDSTISFHVNALPQSTQALRLALTTILRRKGRVLDAMTDSVAVVRRSVQAGDHALFNQWAAAQARYTALSFNRPDHMSSADYSDDFAMLR